MKQFITLTFFVLMSFCAYSQGVAGPDRMICSVGSTRLGPTTPCAGCCYQWSPSTGLDDPTKANPIASGLSTTQNYSVTVSMPNGDYLEDDVTVTIYESFLFIYEPEYVGPDMMIPEELKKIPGAQTFVNLDNDDCDADFDYQDTEVTGGDNELVKIRFGYRINLPQRPARDTTTTFSNRLIVYQAVLALAQGTSISGVRLWKSNDKSAGEYIPGQPIDLDPVGFNEYEVLLWAEGLEGHTQQQQVKFTTYAVGDISPACRQDFVSLTVVGIKKMEWIGYDNGYTGLDNPGKNNKDGVLDADPNNKTTTRVQRVFPEAKQLGSSALRNNPSLYIEFTTTLSSPLTLHLKPFDIDDPITEFTFVDPNDNPVVFGSGGAQPYAGEAGLTYTKDDDNRGLPILPSGSTLTAEKSGTFSFPKTIGTTYFSSLIPTGATSTDLYFITSIHPGDNYRVAVTNDPLFLTNLRNLDQYDNLDIVDKCTSPTSDIGCLPIETSLMSPILTVWRTLHVEHDKMKNPTWEENLMVKGYFSDFVGIGSSITQLFAFQKIRPLAEYSPAFVDATMPLKDNSTTPPGRFARGSIRIGDQILVQPQAENEDGAVSVETRITNNGDDDVNLSKDKNITLNSAGEKFLTGILRKPGLPDLEILIDDITRFGNPPTFEVNLVNPIPNLSAYRFSSLSIKGAPFSEVNSITVNSNSQFSINPTADGNSNLHIPIEVRDDDAIDVDGTSGVITDIDFTLAQTIYKSVYIDVVPDGGGNNSYNDGEQIFERNLAFKISDIDADPYSSTSLVEYIGGPESVLRSQSNVTNLKYFWNVYLLSAWQAGTDSDADTWQDKNRIRGQADPDTKIDHCNISKGGRACIIYHEVCRETEKNTIRSIPKTVAHEIGHLFGLTHGANGDKETKVPPCLVGVISNTTEVGIMTASKFNSPSTEFIPYHINLIRSRSKTPGRTE